MRYLFLFLLLLIIIPCSGQNIDSLKRVIQDKSSAKTKGLLLRDIGKAYYQKANYDSVAYYYNKAAGSLRVINQDTVLVNNYTELAQRYARLKNHDKAIACYQRVIELAPKTGSRFALMSALKQVGILYEAKRNYREALNYFRQSFDISDSLDFVKKTQENSPEAYSHNFMGDVMGSIGQKTETAEEILKTIETKSSLNDTLALSINYFNLGILYKIKQMYPQALDALQQCAGFAAKINYLDMQSSAVSEIADLYERTGDYYQSVIYLKKHSELNELKRNAKHITNIEELQIKYEITQREDRLLKQQFEITKRNYWVTGILVVVLLMLVIGFIYYKQTRLKQRNIAMQAIIATEESERRRIAQDLHDSVSQTMSAAKINLTVIGGELPFADNEQRKRFEKVINLVDSGFREVRTISHNMMPWALHKTGLAQVIKQFIDNIKNDTIAINFISRGFDEPYNDTIEIILYRVLQECVNNVMKHAAADRLDIALMRDEETISLTIEDNGKGFDTTRADVYSGMGLNNLQSRINFLNGKVELHSEEGSGTLVSVYIPINKKAL